MTSSAHAAEEVAMSYFATPGGQLYYTVQGAGAPMLLIHGTGMNSDFWGPALLELAKQHCVLAYDRRGYSRSFAAPRRDYHTDAEDAAALLQGLGRAPATVVGWSAGGIVALDLAIHHPDLVNGLVLYEP